MTYTDAVTEPEDDRPLKDAETVVDVELLDTVGFTVKSPD